MVTAGSPSAPARRRGAVPRSAAALRVALFDAYPHAYGGAQRVLHRQAAYLLANGAEVCVVAPSHGTFLDVLATAGITTRVVPTPPALGVFGHQTTGARAARAGVALPAYWWRLGRALRAWRPTIVHVNDQRGMVLAGVPARLAGARLVWHVHSLQPGTLLPAASRRIAHAVLVPNNAVAAQLPALGTGPKVKELPNPAPDIGPFVEPSTGSEIVTTARLYPDKGIDVLLDALAELRADPLPTATLVVLGGSQTGWEQEPARLRARAERLGLGSAVRFAGEVADVLPYLRTAAVYVQPSRTEVMPLAILEAMAAGLPVVATSVGAVPTMITDGVTGLLVPPEDPTALAGALARVLTERRLATRLAAGAWEHARTAHGDDAFGASLLAIYAAVTGP